MLRTACVFGKVSISNNAMTLQLQNMTGAAASSESSTASSPMSPPTTNSLLQMVESGEITAHVSKQDLTQKQLASQLNYLQRLHSLKTGKGGGMESGGPGAADQMVRRSPQRPQHHERYYPSTCTYRRRHRRQRA